MPARFICPKCGKVLRKGPACPRCNGPLQPIPLPHTVLGILMWALAVIGAMMLLAAFTGFGVVALLSLPVLVAALVFNILEDRKLDKIAAGMVHGADAGIRR